MPRRCELGQVASLESCRSSSHSLTVPPNNRLHTGNDEVIFATGFLLLSNHNKIDALAKNAEKSKLLDFFILQYNWIESAIVTLFCAMLTSRHVQSSNFCQGSSGMMTYDDHAP